MHPNQEVAMTARPTEPFRQEHAHLLPHIDQLKVAARELPRLPPEQRHAAVDTALTFLRETLLPHARAEEEVLYPEWARLVGYSEAPAPMIHDHVAIAERIEQLATTSTEAIETLQELLFGLYALILVHFQKEESIQLPVFDQQPADAVAAVLAEMEAHEETDTAH
jgi:iron-sulfur cluster repair protein YtfE (RIC family)